MEVSSVNPLKSYQIYTENMKFSQFDVNLVYIVKRLMKITIEIPHPILFVGSTVLKNEPLFVFSNTIVCDICIPHGVFKQVGFLFNSFRSVPITQFPLINLLWLHFVTCDTRNYQYAHPLIKPPSLQLQRHPHKYHSNLLM